MESGSCIGAGDVIPEYQTLYVQDGVVGEARRLTCEYSPAELKWLLDVEAASTRARAHVHR